MSSLGRGCVAFGAATLRCDAAMPAFGRGRRSEMDPASRSGFRLEPGFQFKPILASEEELDCCVFVGTSHISPV